MISRHRAGRRHSGPDLSGERGLLPTAGTRRSTTARAVSYMTGAHAFKVGFNNGHGEQRSEPDLRAAARHIPLQQRRAESDDAERDAVRDDNGCGQRARRVRAGPVDDQAADAHARRPLRPLRRQLSRADGRTGAARADPQHHVSRRRTTCAGTTSRRKSAPPTTCSATARPRSR